MRQRPRHPRHRRLRALTALCLAGSLALSACSGDDAEGDAGGTDEPGVEAPALSPLTGLPVEGDGPTHPVLAVKIDNSDNSAPQVGLGSADLVVEELVEGGITRLATFFYSEVPEKVGPVRSMRATDIGIVKPLGAVLVASGGAPVTVRRVKAAGIRMFTEGAKGYSRDTGRVAPYNLFMNLDELAGTVKARKSPEPYLPFGEDALPKGAPAAGLTATFSPSSSTTFAFRKGRYVNTSSHAAPGDGFEPSSVLVLRVPVGDAGYVDPAGNPVPETKFTGTGEAMLFHDGRVVRGTWVKRGLHAPVQLKGPGGSLEIPPGKTWIELVPVDGGSVTVVKR